MSRRLAIQDELDVGFLLGRSRHSLTEMILAKEGVKPQAGEQLTLRCGRVLLHSVQDCIIN